VEHDPNTDDQVDEDHDEETSAARAKRLALEQSVDPATWHKGGVGVDP
jgi:hypothetical protein